MAYLKDKQNRSTDVWTEQDRKHRLLDLTQMAITPPNAGIFDTPARSYRLNNEWAKIVIGLVSWLAETPVWKDASDPSFDALQEIMRFMIGYEPPPQPQLRQSPLDNCILEISYDDGQSWSTAFDYSLCLAEESANIEELLQQQTNELLEAINDLYDGTPESVAPDLTYGDADDGFRDDLLCLVLEVMVGQVPS